MFTDEPQYITDLELDVRGTVQRISLDDYIIRVGELKSGSGLKEAVKQIVKRLSLIGLAGQTATKGEKTFILIGEIFTPRTWNQPDNIMLTDVDIDEAMQCIMTIVNDVNNLDDDEIEELLIKKPN
jgi:hypothetical protein